MPLYKRFRRMPLSVQVTEDQYQWLVAAGEARQESAASVVREAIDRLIESVEAGSPAA